MPYSPLNKYAARILDWIRAGSSITEIVNLVEQNLGFQTNPTSVRQLIDRDSILREAWKQQKTRKVAEGLLHGQAAPEGVTRVDDDTIIVTAPPGKRVDQLLIDDILRRRQLDPEEWEVKQILDNQWEANAGKGTKITLFQFKIWLSRKTPISLVFPAIEVAQRPKPRRRTTSEKPLLVFVTGDHQAPHILPDLHELTLEWLTENKPDIQVIHGDLSDFGGISRHRDDPAYDTTVQACVQSAFDILLAYRNAAPDSDMKLRKGNHDDRLRNETLERAERMYGVSAAQYPGDKPEEWVYSLNHLLHLDRLNIEYVEPKGTYEFEQVVLSDFISVRHGHKVAKGHSNGINTAIELGHSVVLGHTHRQSIVRKTLWNSIRKTWDVITAVEAGCMCEPEGGLGFANAGVPDWQPGFATVQIWPDGRFTADLATFEQSGTLRWCNQMYTV